MVLIKVSVLASLFGVHIKYFHLPCHNYQLLFNYFYIAQFSCAALAVKSRFKSINNYLTSSFARKNSLGSVRTLINSNKVDSLQSTSFDFNVRLFTELYNDLCDAIEMINSTFTRHLIIVTLSLLLTDVFAAYGILREFMTRSQKLGFYLLSNGSWIVMQLAFKCLMVYSGSSTTKEAEKSVTIVTRAAGKLEINDVIKADLNSLLLQMRCRSKSIENSFFTINWTLIVAVSLN